MVTETCLHVFSAEIDTFYGLPCYGKTCVKQRFGREVPNLGAITNKILLLLISPNVFWIVEAIRTTAKKIYLVLDKTDTVRWEEDVVHLRILGALISKDTDFLPYHLRSPCILLTSDARKRCLFQHWQQIHWPSAIVFRKNVNFWKALSKSV